MTNADWDMIGISAIIITWLIASIKAYPKVRKDFTHNRRLAAATLSGFLFTVIMAAFVAAGIWLAILAWDGLEWFYTLLTQ